MTPRASDDPSLSPVKQVEALLDESCGTCHGAAKRRRCSVGTCDGMTFIDDMARLIEEQKVVPCAWEGTQLASYLADELMHAALYRFAPMSRADRGRIESFALGMCSDLTQGGPGDAERSALGAKLRRVPRRGARRRRSAPGGIGNISDIGTLIDAGLITPCVSSGSPIVGAMRDGRMPPPDSAAPRPSQDDISALAAPLLALTARR